MATAVCEDGHPLIRTVQTNTCCCSKCFSLLEEGKDAMECVPCIYMLCFDCAGVDPSSAPTAAMNKLNINPPAPPPPVPKAASTPAPALAPKPPPSAVPKAAPTPAPALAPKPPASAFGSQPLPPPPPGTGFKAKIPQYTSQPAVLEIIDIQRACPKSHSLIDSSRECVCVNCKKTVYKTKSCGRCNWDSCYDCYGAPPPKPVVSTKSHNPPPLDQATIQRACPMNHSLIDSSRRCVCVNCKQTKFTSKSCGRCDWDCCIECYEPPKVEQVSWSAKMAAKPGEKMYMPSEIDDMHAREQQRRNEIAQREAMCDRDDDDDDYSGGRGGSTRSSGSKSSKPAQAKPSTRKCPQCGGKGQSACGGSCKASKCGRCGGSRKITCGVCKGRGEIKA